jgi:hypothetical protein
VIRHYIAGQHASEHVPAGMQAAPSLRLYLQRRQGASTGPSCRQSWQALTFVCVQARPLSTEEVLDEIDVLEVMHALPVQAAGVLHT